VRHVSLALAAFVVACASPAIAVPSVVPSSAPTEVALTSPTATPTTVPTAAPTVAPTVPTAPATAAPAAQRTVAPVPRATTAPAQAEQFRAYWADAFGEGMRTAAEIDQVVAAAKAANLNAIIAQVVRRGDCFCNRAGLPRTEAAGVAPAPFDPLQTLIEKAHAEGLEVHAWVIVTGIWRGTAAPKDPRHVFNTNGPSATGDAYWLMTRSDGADRLQAEGAEFYLDPGHPDAAAYMVRMATSIVQQYAVDGINLDRIRYPDGNLNGAPSWGYNPTALARFRAETGRTDTPAATDAQWTQWRRDRITDIVRRVYAESTAFRPGIRVSVDTITYGEAPQSAGGWDRTRAYREVLQDWVSWMRAGIVDMNVPMAYKRDGDAAQKRQYDEWVAFAKEQHHGRHIAIGTALYLNEVDQSLRQVTAAVSSSDAGWVGYSYRSPDTLATAGTRSGAATRELLVRALTAPSGPFARPARVPVMAWKAKP
jgi:uncharacterized lipoprotein YddW (UPF0748 family)